MVKGADEPHFHQVPQVWARRCKDIESRCLLLKARTELYCFATRKNLLYTPEDNFTTSINFYQSFNHICMQILAFQYQSNPEQKYSWSFPF